MFEGGFKLRKWLTNDSSVRGKIESDLSDILTQGAVREENVTNDAGVTSKTESGSSAEVINGAVSEEDISYAKTFVGMQLSGVQGPKGAAFGLGLYRRRAEGLPATKRNTLRLIAGIFDPLGIIGPATIIAKILFQEACRQKIGWDDRLDEKVRQNLEACIKDLIECHQITIRRCVYEHVPEDVLECSLHGFADASKKAYCAVIYLIYRTHTGRYSKMLTSKTRLSIPRLELMAALILVILMSTVKNALSSQMRIQQTKLWSDSITVLYWIMNQGEWKQFVRHRVNEILFNHPEIRGDLENQRIEWRFNP